MENVSYKDIDIFTGIDVHKRSWDIKIMTAHTSQKQIHRAEPSAEFVAQYLKRHYPGANTTVSMKLVLADFGYKKN